MTAATILFDAISVERANIFSFDVWYANRYLASMVGRGCFASVRRYVSPIRGSYLAVFEASSDLLTSNPGSDHDAVIARERYVADYIGGRTAPGADARTPEADILYAVFFAVPKAREREFNAWYDEEHMEMLLRCEHWPMCRRYRIRNPAADGFTHIALHYLTDLRALESPERDQARSTPWRDRLAAEAWFKGEYRVYYQWGGQLCRA